MVCKSVFCLYEFSLVLQSPAPLLRCIGDVVGDLENKVSGICHLTVTVQG